VSIIKAFETLKNFYVGTNMEQKLLRRYEYGTKEHTLQPLKQCQKRSHMDCWEALFIQTLRHQKLLIEEQQVSDTNPIYRLAQIPHAL
jgi:hypothetical protein